MMSSMTATSTAPTSTSRRGRRQAGGTWASTHAASEPDDLSGPPSPVLISSVFPAGGDSYVRRGQLAVPKGAIRGPATLRAVTRPNLRVDHDRVELTLLLRDLP